MTELRSVQVEALKRSQGQEGFIYGMEPGLGKTLIVLHEFDILRRYGGEIKRLLIIAPNSVLGTWRDEIKQHGFNYFVGPPSDLNVMAALINYEAVIYTSGIAAKAYIRMHPCMLVLDETSRIKSYKAKTTQVILKDIVPHAKLVRLLNGTPITENVEEVFPQLLACGALVGVNRYAFRRRYAKFGGYMNKEIVGAINEDKLANIMAPYVFIAKKAEWAKDLPEKQFMRRYTKMYPEQQKLYDDLRHKFLADYDGKQITAPAVIAIYQKLVQISAGFFIDDDKQNVLLKERSPKLIALKDLLEELGSEQKTIVVALNRFALTMIYNLAESMHKKAVIIRGGEDIETAKYAFNNDDHIDICALGVQAGGVGLTLLGTKTKPCSTMIFFQNSWSAFLRTQVIERIHRFGQHFPCSYYDLIGSPIDSSILDALDNKADLAESVLGGLRTAPE